MSAKTECPRVALVLGTVMSRRVARGLFGSLDRRVECLLIDAARSLRDIERRLQAWRPHAIVVHGTPHTSGLLRASRRAPVLLVGHVESSAAAAAAAPAYQVCVDEAAVGRLAASYYRDRGLRHFAFYGAPQAFSRARQEAFARTLLDAGFRSACFFDQERRSFHSLEGGVGSRRLNAWLRRLPRPIGVFAAHDSDGVQLLQACRHLGLRVPQDVAVVGVNDDAVICSVAFPPLSSVAIPWQRLGEDIARLIGQCLRTGGGAGAAPERLLVPPIALITRESSDLFAVSHPGVARALRHCADRVEEPLGVAAFARRAGVSRRLLEMVLRQELGCSPLEVLHRIRIERAKTLLNDTDAKLADIAARCGFAYAERFSVVFKRLTGQTPAAFRRRFSGD